MTYVSHADLGGGPCAAPVVDEPEDLRFHAAWEARALAVTLAMGATGCWNLDMSRAARETLPDYAALSYYQVWIAALERLLIERGLVSRDELSAGQALTPPLPVPLRLAAADVAAALAKGSPTIRPATRPARFAVGDPVRARAGRVPHHTRLPGYAAGRVGRVERVHGVHVFADAHAHGLGEDPQWLYTVSFDSRELWGDAAAARLSVAVDAWEPYLVPA
jgi:nitrile hydratase beta subunit